MTNYPPIDQLLPHDDPMILIDTAVDIQQDTVHCQVTIGPNNPFFNAESDSVPSYVGIEFMAQSVAAWSGYHALMQGAEPPIGFLLGSRRYHSECTRFKRGLLLDIQAEKVIQDNGMAVFACKIFDQDNCVASCQLNVFVPNEQQLEQMQLRS
ncbi:hotdog family protein [Vibrio sp.]|uniref:hotdog family protein n=1 Tax=Vibrio sp. TaxID=678 RepID=UPI003D0DF9B1